MGFDNRLDNCGFLQVFANGPLPTLGPLDGQRGNPSPQSIEDGQISLIGKIMRLQKKLLRFY